MPIHTPIEIDPLPKWQSDIDEVCAWHNIGRKDLFSTTRAHNVKACRHQLWWRLHRKYGHSLNQIGKRLGGYHHATVLNGVRRHDAKRNQGTTT